MGKGQRNRKNADHRQEDCAQLRLKADKAAFASKGYAVAACALTAVAVLFQCILQSVMRANLNSGAYEALQTDAAEIAALRSALPIGAIGLALLLLGSALALLFICRKKPRLSLIGCALLAVGVAFFIPYVCQLAELFRFDPLVGVNGRGLDFRALFLQHYSALLPLILWIPAVWYAFSAAKKASLATIMEQAQSTVSTISLDDSE